MIRYAITDRSLFAGTEQQRSAALVAKAEEWAALGVEYVQLREKDLEAGALVSLARQLVAVLGAHTKLLVNGRADVAVAAGAAGVHLTAHPDELTAEQVRRVFALAGRPTPVVSVSCHTVDEARRAQIGGADLVLFGPVFEKAVAQRVVAEGVEQLREVCAAVTPRNVLALGGVTQENAALCIEAGAAGVAGIRLFISCAPSPAE